MNCLNIFLSLLVAYSITLTNASGTDDLASRLEILALDPENDERFNEINDVVDTNSLYFPKWREQQKYVKNILGNMDASTRTPEDDNEESRNLEASKGIRRMMVSSMYNLIRRFLH